jgi:hypothetical protein
VAFCKARGICISHEGAKKVGSKTEANEIVNVEESGASRDASAGAFQSSVVGPAGNVAEGHD